MKVSLLQSVFIYLLIKLYFEMFNKRKLRFISYPLYCSNITILLNIDKTLGIIIAGKVLYLGLSKDV
jgi:hypothetical protein